MPPMNSERPTTATATKSEMRVPKRMRERMSRPSSSVPKRWARLGEARRLARLSVVGSEGASQGASRAASVKPRSRANPSTASGLRLAEARWEAVVAAGSGGLETEAMTPACRRWSRGANDAAART